MRMNQAHSRLTAILLAVLFFSTLGVISATAQNQDQQQAIETIMQRLSETDSSDLQAFESGYKEAIACCPDTNLVHEAYMRLNNLWLYGYDEPKNTERIALAEQYLLVYGDAAPQSAEMINTLTATYGEAGQHDKLAKLYDPYFATPPTPFPLDQYEAHRFAYAEALEKSGRMVEALTQYQTVVTKGEVMDFLLRIAGERVAALQGATSAQPAPQAAAPAPGPTPDEPLPPDPAIPGEPEYDQGLAAFTAKNYAEALQYFDTAARAGNTAAQYSLGMMLYKGLGTPVDMAEAANWFAKAKAGGHPKAASMLARTQSKSDGTAATPAPSPKLAVEPGPERKQGEATLAANGFLVTYPEEWLNPAEPTDPLNVATSPQGFEDLPDESTLESREHTGEMVLFAPGAAQPLTDAAFKLDSNGKLASITQYRGGKKHGKRYSFKYTFGSDGKYLERMEEYKNGKLDGTVSIYRENGNLSSRMDYREGVMDGSHFGWNPDMIPLLWESYKNNMLDGYSLQLYENGNPMSFVEYERDHNQGLSLSFYENGQLRARQLFDKGMCAGPREEFNPDGTLKASTPCQQ